MAEVSPVTYVVENLFVSCLFQQHDCVGTDAFFAACEAEVFGGGGLDGDVVKVDVHYLGEGLLHLGNVGIEFGPFGTNRAVDVSDGVAFGGHDVEGAAEENLGVDVFKLVALLGREVVADVAHVGGTEDGVADGMDEDIGIGVAKQSEGVLYLDAAEPQGATFHQLVDIEAKADAGFHLVSFVFGASFF